jgi:hypothetical protein
VRAPLAPSLPAQDTAKVGTGLIAGKMTYLLTSGKKIWEGHAAMTSTENIPGPTPQALVAVTVTVWVPVTVQL